MQRRRLIKILLSIVAGILIILAAAWWFLGLVFDESRDIPRYSPAYWLLVPDIIRRLPLDYCREPLYHYSTGDGSKPLMVTRRCRTSDPSTAIAHYRELFLKSGYTVPDRGTDYFHREYTHLHQDDHVLKLLARAPDQFEIIYME